MSRSVQRFKGSKVHSAVTARHKAHTKIHYYTYYTYSVCDVRMRKRAPRDFNGRTEVRKDGSVAVKTDGRMESSPRIAERDGPSRLP